MKYQVYLNKQTSTIVEAIALKDNKKPNTIIKQLLETMFKTAVEAEKEWNKKNG